MNKYVPYVIALGAVGLILGVVGVVKAKQFAPPPPFEFPPEAVTSAPAEGQEWELSLTAIGTLRASQGVEVTTESPGVIEAIHFSSGDVVAEGQVLVTLDTRVEQAQLAAARAGAELAEINVNRARELFARNAGSRSDLDAAEAEVKRAEADVRAIEATLARKTIRAPFAGRLGIRQINLGEYINPGGTIVSLQNLDPMKVDFTLPQQRLSELTVGMRLRLTTDARPGQVFEGQVSAISPVIDQSTRSVRVEGTLANRGELLQPGLFASVEVVLPQRKPVVAVPATAVYYQSYGDLLFVIVPGENAKGEPVRKAEQRFVRLGLRRGDFVEVAEGVQAGEEVVTSGAFKLSNGRTVMVDNSLAPQPSLEPTPADS